MRTPKRKPKKRLREKALKKLHHRQMLFIRQGITLDPSAQYRYGWWEESQSETSDE